MVEMIHGCPDHLSQEETLSKGLCLFLAVAGMAEAQRAVFHECASMLIFFFLAGKKFSLAHCRSIVESQWQGKRSHKLSMRCADSFAFPAEVDSMFYYIFFSPCTFHW